VLLEDAVAEDLEAQLGAQRRGEQRDDGDVLLRKGGAESMAEHACTPYTQPIVCVYMKMGMYEYKSTHTDTHAYT